MNDRLAPHRIKTPSAWDGKTCRETPLTQWADVGGDRQKSTPTDLPQHFIHFKRRDRLQLPETGFWQITKGVIVASILSEEGNLIPLGIWSAGDLLGYPLMCHASLDVESITQATVLPIVTPHPELLLRQSLQQLKQNQMLLTLRHGPVIQRITNLLIWLGERFGKTTDHGLAINLRLTHQMIADFVGSTRVTATRLLQQLQQDGVLFCGKDHVLYLPIPERQDNRNISAEMQPSYFPIP